MATSCCSTCSASSRAKSSGAERTSGPSSPRTSRDERRPRPHIAPRERPHQGPRQEGARAEGRLRQPGLKEARAAPRRQTKTQEELSPADVERAARDLEPHLLPTPMQLSRALSYATGLEVYL